MIRELQRRIEVLERSSPLENASITSGTLRVGTPEGIRGDAKDSVTITAAEGFKVATGASGKVDPGAKIYAGAAEINGDHGGKVGAGGTWVSADGIIRNDGGKVGFGHPIDVVGGVKASGQVDPGSVLMTWNGARHTLEQVTGWIQGDVNAVSTRTTTAQSTADSAASAASAAQSSANAAQGTADTALSTANGAQSRADSAYSLASTKASQTAHDTLDDEVSKMGLSLSSLRNHYNEHLDLYHGGGSSKA